MSRPALPTRAAAGLTLALALAGCSASAPARLSPPTTTSPSASAEPTLAPTLDPHSQVGGLVAGFPGLLLPVPAGATVLLSSAAPTDDGALQVSLNLRTGQDAAGVLAAVRDPLLAAGFLEIPVDPPAEGLAVQTTFARSDGAEMLVVAVLDQGGTRTVSIGGRVAAGTP